LRPAARATLMSSEKMDWQTPDNVLDLVREVYGGAIVLDPSIFAWVIASFTGMVLW